MYVIRRFISCIVCFAALCVAHGASGMYNSTTGRWISRDPSGERGAKVVYAFVENEPLSKHDVLGLESKSYDIDGYPFTVTANVFEGIWGLCNPIGTPITPPELIFSVWMTSNHYESGGNVNWPNTGVKFNFDGEVEAYEYDVDGSNISFKTSKSEAMRICPSGPQKGSTTFEADIHDDNHRTTWRKVVIIGMAWEYECNKCCRGFKKGLEVKFTWQGPKEVEEKSNSY